MPTYEYACRDCGQHLEVVQSFRDAPLTTCGGCNGSLRRVFSAAGIIFKGSGYYVTDTRKKPDEGSPKKSGDGAKADRPAKDTGSPAADSGSSSSGGSRGAAESA